jgi:hypothetical protein
VNLVLWCELVAEETSAAAVFDGLRSVANRLMRGVCPPASELAADLRQIHERISAAGDILCVTVAEPSAMAELDEDSRGGGALEEALGSSGVGRGLRPLVFSIRDRRNVFKSRVWDVWQDRPSETAVWPPVRGAPVKIFFCFSPVSGGMSFLGRGQEDLQW